MGIPNVEGGPYIYLGGYVPPTPTPASKKRDRFPWVLYARKFRQNRQGNNFML